MVETFEPKIVAFLCNWCSYAGADMAGISRIQYKPNIRVVRVMCSGRVNPVFIFEAFLCGFDGVLVLGCHPESCQYLSGSSRAEKRMKRLASALEKAGVDSSKLCFGGLMSAEPHRFVEYVGGS